MNITRYLRLWLACARYSVTRTLMFRMDFIMWGLVELFWMGVNVAAISVIYRHTDSIAGWNKYQTLVLIGTSMMTQRLLMGLFWSNLFEMGRNVRTGHFDFFLAQPGNLMFTVSTRKIDLDSLVNVAVAGALVYYAANQLNLHPTPGTVALYLFLVLLAVVIHYSLLMTIASLTFWIVKTDGIEHSYFTLSEFSRMPREAFRGLYQIVFVWTLPVVIMSNAPARTILHGFEPKFVLWMAGCAIGWFAFTVWFFHLSIRRYTSASS